jgi:hypothetical protein
MALAERSEAVRTAGERLEAIEAWSRRTFVAAAFGAAMLAILAGLAVYVGIDYLQMKAAMGEAAASFQRDMQQRFPAARPAGKAAPLGSPGRGGF